MTMIVRPPIEEFDLAEEEDIAMLTMVHKNKRAKHDRSMFGREFLRRERVEAHERLMKLFCSKSRLSRKVFLMPVQNVYKFVSPCLQFCEEI